MRIIIVLLFTFLPFLVFPQLGLQQVSDDALEAYTLFTSDPGFRSEDVHLVDNCGHIINEWLDLPAARHHYKLLPNGNLNWIADNERIIEMDWDGNIVVDHFIADGNLFLNYEVIKLPSGNYLSLGRRTYDLSFFIELGYDLSLGNPEYCDVVLEIDKDSGEIVWEWNICDHAIQDRDPNLNNFGVLSENPQLLDMGSIGTFDWENQETFMINGMDYNPELDQIALSVRKMSEVALIDHSTTTEEASGSTGGNSGKGGDIIYRFGNPQNYDRGNDEDRILYFQHNPNWIQHGPHKGKIIVYNNGLTRPGTSFNTRYSSVEIFEPVTDSDGNYLIDDENPFMPTESDFEFSSVTMGADFYSGYESGTQILPNGNLLIAPNSEATIMEYTMDGELLWRYNTDRLFRAERYSVDYPAFEGRDLTPGNSLWPASFVCSDTPDLDLDEDGFTPNEGDCNDTDPEVNPDQEEEPYNGIDDDCNIDTPDDDLDGDGFPLSLDCDDMNAEVNFLQEEIPYNGIDDDCFEFTLDDDLDQDGFLLVDDCDDMNPSINPAATEIPNNGIDENCDGLDDVNSSTDETSISVLSLYPNPTTAELFIDAGNISIAKIKVYNLLGHLMYAGPYERSIDVSAYDSGMYLFQARSNNNEILIRKFVVAER